MENAGFAYQMLCKSWTQLSFWLWLKVGALRMVCYKSLFEHLWPSDLLNLEGWQGGGLRGTEHEFLEGFFPYPSLCIPQHVVLQCFGHSSYISV